MKNDFITPPVIVIQTTEGRKDLEDMMLMHTRFFASL
jgi:hypothetical protein